MDNSFYTEQELRDLGLKKYGSNVKISRYARLYSKEEIEIGNNVRIDDFTVLSGKIKLGNYIHIAPYTCLFGGEYGIELDDFSTISSRGAIYAITDDYTGKNMTNPTVPEEYRGVTGGKVIIKRHTIIGTGVTVLPNVVISEGVAVGSMSLVNNNLEAWGIYYGIPCKRHKERKRELLEKENNLLKELEESNKRL